MANGRERRKKERYDANLFIEFESSILKEDLGRGVVVDVSLSGFAVETETELEPGDLLNCHIEIPLYLKAKVVRRITSGQIKKYGMIIMNQGFLDKFVMKRILGGKRKTKKV